MKNYLRILYLVSIFGLGLYVFFHIKPIETSVLKAVVTNSIQDEIILEMNKNSSLFFEIIIKSDNPEIKEEILENIDKDVFEQATFETEELFKGYGAHPYNLLSREDYFNIKNKNYEKIKQESAQRLYSLGTADIVPIEKDPFLLLGNFLKEISTINYHDTSKADKAGFDTIKLKIKNDGSISSDTIHKKMSEIAKLKEKYKDEIYLTGTPVHTYYASSKSMKEINIISIFSLLFVIFMVKRFFGSYKILIPVFLSILMGILTGYIFTSLFFNEIHVLTFVFSTVLIGISVDYSLHYFACKKSSKSLFTGMITTVLAFFMLSFSGINLLKQISVFTMFGLISVYLFVVLFYPLINIKTNIKAPKFPKLNKKVITGIILLVAIYGMFNVKYSDEIKNMYKPDKSLAEGEKIKAEIEGGVGLKLILVDGKTEQERLEKEEEITSNLNTADYFCMSKLVPSHKKQKENRELIKTLYKKELNNYATFLPYKLRKEALKFDEGYIETNIIPHQLLNTFKMIGQNAIYVTNGEIKDPSINVFDIEKEILSRVKNLRIKCTKLLFPAILILTLFLWAAFGFKKGIKILLPSVVACFFVTGILARFDVHLSFFDILAFFLITGFSLDYSIFKMNETNPETDTAVFVSFLTSGFSFLLLSLTSFNLIVNLGFDLSLGLLASFILSTVFSSPSKKTKWFEQKEKSAGKFRLLISLYIYKILGKKPVQFIAFLVSFFTFIFSPELRLYSKKNLSAIYDFSKQNKVKPNIINCFRLVLNYSLSLVDKMEVFMNRFDYKKIIFEKEFKSNGGKFFICTHTGNIDILRAFALNLPDSPNVNIFVSEEQSKIFNSFLKTVEEKKNLSVYNIENISPDSSIILKEKLDKGEYAFMAGDRISKNKSFKTKFLNKEIELPVGTFKFAQLMDTDIVFISAIKIKNDKYKVYFEEFRPDKTFTRKENLEKMETEYVKFLEDMAKRAPLQFYHFYDLF